MTDNQNNGIGFTGCLFLIFLILKLAKVGDITNWSWWAVTSPLWIPLALVLGILMIIGIGVFLVTLFSCFINRN